MAQTWGMNKINQLVQHFIYSFSFRDLRYPSV